MKTLTAREVILYLSIKYNGNWSDIFNAVRKKERIDLEEYEKITNNISCSYVTILDADYPNSLKSVYRPPFVLFYYGDLSLINKQTIGVIGPRENTKYAKENCESIVNELSSKLVIVSGLAKGIDSIAHQACVNAGGKTIAVLGSGIDNCYPKENLLLYNIITIALYDKKVILYNNFGILLQYPTHSQGEVGEMRRNIPLLLF